MSLTLPTSPARAAVVLTSLVLAAATVFLPQPAAAAGPDWVPAAQASIHPGVETITSGAQCTANFVFTDPAGGVYIGQSAHCAGTGSSNETDGCLAGSLPLGTAVSVDGASRPGTLVYSSWLTMQAVGETDPDACAFNDFALVLLDRADHARVNPSLPFYGGPQGIATTTTAGQTVYTFGNSSLRPGNGSAKSGTSSGTDGNGWTHDVRTVLNPGVPGDSGSGFIDDAGRAFGALSTLEVLPSPGSNGVSDLTLMLAYLAEHTDLDVTMADGTLLFDPAGATVDTATGAPVGGDGAQTQRLTGPTRIETAVATSVDAFTAGSAGAVVLGRSDVAADALAGTPLAAGDDGPLLLSTSQSLHPATAAEIDRVLPAGGTVYLLGGTAALSAQVEADLSGYTVRRLSGPSRIETALAVAREVTSSPAEILLADGQTFADALVSGPAAASVGGVVVLTDGPRSHPAVDAYLAEEPAADVVTVGQAATSAYPGRTSYVGSSDPQTSVLVAQAYADGATVVGLARVDVFADALSGGTHVAGRGGPLLLTSRDALSGVVETHLRERAATIDTAVLYGGTSALSTTVEEQARAAIS